MYLLDQLEKAAQRFGYTYNIGVSITKASFYTQLAAESKPVGYDLVNRWNAYEKGGATSTEMESAALFIIGACLGIRVATVLVSATNYKNYSNDSKKNGPGEWEHRAIEVGIEAMRSIISDDQKTVMHDHKHPAV
jgi:uridine phosphorylase